LVGWLKSGVSQSSNGRLERNFKSKVAKCSFTVSTIGGIGAAQLGSMETHKVGGVTWHANIWGNEFGGHAISMPHRT